MELNFHSSEADGAEGALRRAWMLNKESGYNILSIRHGLVPMADGALARRGMEQRRLGLGYEIVVETLPKLFSDLIPTIAEM